MKAVNRPKLSFDHFSANSKATFDSLDNMTATTIYQQTSGFYDILLVAETKINN